MPYRPQNRTDSNMWERLERKPKQEINRVKTWSGNHKSVIEKLTSLPGCPKPKVIVRIIQSKETDTLLKDLLFVQF